MHTFNPVVVFFLIPKKIQTLQKLKTNIVYIFIWFNLSF